MALKKPAPKAPAKKAAPTAAKAGPAKGKAATGTAGKEAAPAKAAPAATVTLKILATEFAERHEMTRARADTMLGDLVTMMVGHLTAGDRLRIGGLGILEVKNRPARMGRNPATGEAIPIKASKKVAFRAAKELKEAI